MTPLIFNSFLKPIHIPPELRRQAIKSMAMSVRLAGVLRRANIRVLGDLHGCKLDDFAWQRNCGYKTLHELDALVRQAHSSVQQTSEPQAGSLVPGNDVSLVVPESISQLRFAELPITSRLANVVQSIGLRTLGDLNSRSASELLRCKNCGWRTVVEIGQLIERAISGEFDEAEIEESARPTELLRLLEEGMAKLSPRDKHLLLARIGGEGVPPTTLEELGQQHALTRARVQQVLQKTLRNLRKTWGPRLPRLLEAVKRRCFSNVCPLTPALLGQWIDEAHSTFQLSPKAQVRLIGALDEDVPCWPNQQDGVGGVDNSIRRLDLDLAKLARNANGCIAVADAYGKLTSQQRYKGLKVGKFLGMLRRVRRTLVEFDDPQRPVIRLSRLSTTDFATHILEQSDEPLTAEEIRSRAIQTFGTKIIRCEARAISNALSSNQSVFLIGPGVYATRKHFKLPVSEWNRVRGEFAQLLAKESRPISCYEVLKDRLIAGLTNVRPEELAYILRKDSQFVDLGFLIFAHATWGSDPEFRREMSRRRRFRVGGCEGERKGVHEVVLHSVGVQPRTYRARRSVLAVL
jgi:Sigma-70, region 4/Bacterial RNA polymerase, alpha chain C terminal domain